MRRVVIDPRLGWQRIVENYGFEHHSIAADEGPGNYWNEAAYYELMPDEVERIERATNQLEEMCIALVEAVIRDNLFARLHLSPYAADLVRQSWERDDRSLYGRFDFSLGADGSLKMLEYNADTPTSLFEAAVAQWQWLQERFPDHDQFNSIHERLIEAWKSRSGLIHFACLDDSESVVTTAYLEDTARQARIGTCFLTLADIGWDGKRFVDLQGRPIDTLFKLYPWEWLLTDRFGEHLRGCGVRFIEPAWKMVLSNKAMLPLLHEMFPGHEHLLGASGTTPYGVNSYVRKPVLGREGANVEIVKNGQSAQRTGGDYTGECIYQEYHPTVTFDNGGREVTPIVGSWVVNGEAAGVGIREDFGVTTNAARFVPHLIAP